MRRLARWQEKHQPHAAHDFYGRPAFNEGNAGTWQGQDGHALHPDAPVAQANGNGYNNGAYAQPTYPQHGYGQGQGVDSVAPRTSTAQNSEAGLIRHDMRQV